MLRFCDGFDHYTNLSDMVPAKWTAYTNPSYSNTPGVIAGSTFTRYSAGRSYLITGASYGIYYQASISKYVGVQPTWTIGLAINFNGNNFTLLNIIDSLASSTQLCLVVNSSGTLSLYRGQSGTLLATSTMVLSSGVWYYLEVKVTISGTVGTYEVRVNGASVIGPVTGANTRNSANSSADTFQLLSPVGNAIYVDDLYILDGQGSVNNSFWGEVRIQTLLPTGAGNYTQWTPDSGSNYARVNEAIVDSDTSYIASSTPGQKDSYTYTQLVGTPNILGVQANLWARKDDAATRQIQPLIRIAGTDYLGTTQNMSSGYNDYTIPYDVSPATGTTWGKAEINGAQFGVNEVT